MTRGTVFVTTEKLGGRADAMLVDAGFKPVYAPAGLRQADLVPLVAELQTESGPVVAIVSRSLRLGAEVFSALPDLRIISKHGAGVDNIDVVAATERGIAVARAAGTNSRSVAELALGLIFATTRNLVPLAVSTAEGAWDRKSWGGEEVSDKTIGLVGFGQIGRELGRMATAVCRRVIVADPYADPEDIRAIGATAVSLPELQQNADIVSLHCPLTEETRGLINHAFLSGMARGSYLINTARGEIVDEAAVVTALDSGQLAGAALDSMQVEAAGKTALRSHPKAIVTPHIGGNTYQALEKVAEHTVANIINFLDGKELRRADIVR